ncbi:MAG: AtpZ/AtpI family protein [bacterium]
MSPYTAYAVYGAVGFQLAISVVAGLVFGNYLDKRLGTGPWIAITGLTLGFVGGLVNLIKITKRYEKIKSKGTGTDENPFKR